MPAIGKSRNEIYEDLRSRILNRAHGYRTGDRLPSHDDMAAAYGVSLATVQRAVDLLKHDGLVYTRGGAGTVVSAPE